MWFPYFGWSEYQSSWQCLHQVAMWWWFRVQFDARSVSAYHLPQGLKYGSRFNFAWETRHDPDGVHLLVGVCQVISLVKSCVLTQLFRCRCLFTFGLKDFSDLVLVNWAGVSSCASWRGWPEYMVKVIHNHCNGPEHLSEHDNIVM